jgi:nuclear cap-binding protein subunit 1
LEQNIEGLADVLDMDLATNKGRIMRILTESVVKMPEKCTLYSTLLGLMNIKNYSFGAEVSPLISLIIDYLLNFDFVVR